MYQPPPGVDLSRAHRRAVLFTTLLGILGLVSVIAAVWVVTRTNVTDALLSMIVAALCLSYTAWRVWKIHA